jgi:hypothetical protein
MMPVKKRTPQVEAVRGYVEGAPKTWWTSSTGRRDRPGEPP